MAEASEVAKALSPTAGRGSPAAACRTPAVSTVSDSFTAPTVAAASPSTATGTDAPGIEAADATVTAPKAETAFADGSTLRLGVLRRLAGRSDAAGVPEGSVKKGFEAASAPSLKVPAGKDIWAEIRPIPATGTCGDSDGGTAPPCEPADAPAAPRSGCELAVPGA